MNYCGECGSPLRLDWISQEARHRHVCTSCGTTSYRNPRIIVGCLASWKNELLLCRRSEEPARGQWTLPSGYLECDETLEEGAARETYEETGVIVDPTCLDLCMVVNMTAIQQVAIAFRVELDAEPTPQPGRECTEAALFSEGEIPAEQIAWHDSWGCGLRRYFQDLRQREYTVQVMTLGLAPGTDFKSREYGLYRGATNG